MLVADKETTLMISGNGDVVEPHDGVMAIGSGAPYASAAARALLSVQGSHPFINRGRGVKSETGGERQLYFGPTD